MTALTEKLSNAKTEAVDVKPEVSKDEPSSVEGKSDESSSEDDSSNSNCTQNGNLHVRTPRHSAKQLYPPGFKEMRGRLQPFSGKQGEVNFQLRLEDYEEATVDCQWSDEERARWFSWFITGPAKATWQRTLNRDDKAAWK